jgi:hypothetical protein
MHNEKKNSWQNHHNEQKNDFISAQIQIKKKRTEWIQDQIMTLKMRQFRLATLTLEIRGWCRSSWPAARIQWQTT